MTRITRLLRRIALWSDESGQDLVEYALLASLVAVGSGLFAPSISENMSTIYSRIASKLLEAGG